MTHALSSPRRRQLVKGALAALAVPRFARARAANGKVNLACVGIGNRAADVVKALHATGLANIVALCDVDMGAPHTLEIMKLFPDVPRFQDFRTMFDKMGKQIDAVSVGTPDFSHFPVAMLAMSQGKHVYCEKPMGQSFREIELMMAAERKYKVAAQMGNQGHSEANYFQFKSWVDAGIIKNVRAITAHMNNPRRWHGMKVSGYLPRRPLPATLDWDGWVATGAYHEYNPGYINGDWRSWFDYGNGALGDWGAHIFDTAHEFLQLGLPTEVEAVRLEGWSPLIFPQASTLAFRFPQRGALPPLELTWYDGVDNLPPLPKDFGAAIVDPNIPPPSKGSGNAPVLPPGKIIYGDGLTFKGGSHGSELRIIGDAGRDLALPNVPKSPSNHFANFLKACMGEETCRSSFAVAGPLCQAMALGVIAQRVNGKLSFDPAGKRITNNAQANALLAGAPPRKGWEQYYKLA
ncbi:Gfo/Idh/MocA family oxidoreductase [Burkholderia sp. LMU1-1-1.1]|uniref:Gfo/Idh/MocA family oxidoreductase n=1 Tax=Burkholderia sp. LMU1-1-1.1 TaxID=3135266 RepID=UPI003417C2A1